jgi:hypothetical protein
MVGQAPPTRTWPSTRVGTIPRLVCLAHVMAAGDPLPRARPRSVTTGRRRRPRGRPVDRPPRPADGVLARPHIARGYKRATRRPVFPVARLGPLAPELGRFDRLQRAGGVGTCHPVGSVGRSPRVNAGISPKAGHRDRDRATVGPAQPQVDPACDTRLRGRARYWWPIALRTTSRAISAISRWPTGPWWMRSE